MNENESFQFENDHWGNQNKELEEVSSENKAKQSPACKRGTLGASATHVQIIIMPTMSCIHHHRYVPSLVLVLFQLLLDLVQELLRLRCVGVSLRRGGCCWATGS